MKEQELILSLIKDDLTNFRLVSGLNSLGLNADDYCLYLSDTIFILMGFENSQYSDMVYEKIYQALAEKTREIDFSTSKDKLGDLALEIYNELLKAKEIREEH